MLISLDVVDVAPHWQTGENPKFCSTESKLVFSPIAIIFNCSRVTGGLGEMDSITVAAGVTTRSGTWTFATFTPRSLRYEIDQFVVGVVVWPAYVDGLSLQVVSLDALDDTSRHVVDGDGLKHRLSIAHDRRQGGHLDQSRQPVHELVALAKADGEPNHGAVQVAARDLLFGHPA